MEIQNPEVKVIAKDYKLTLYTLDLKRLHTSTLYKLHLLSNGHHHWKPCLLQYEKVGNSKEGKPWRWNVTYIYAQLAYRWHIRITYILRTSCIHEKRMRQVRNWAHAQNVHKYTDVNSLAHIVEWQLVCAQNGCKMHTYMSSAHMQHTYKLHYVLCIYCRHIKLYNNYKLTDLIVLIVNCSDILSVRWCFSLTKYPGLNKCGESSHCSRIILHTKSHLTATLCLSLWPSLTLHIRTTRL